MHWVHQQLDPTFALDVYLTTPESSTAEVGQIAIAHPAELVIVFCLRTPPIKVTTDLPQKVVIDGELIGKTSIAVQCLPAS